VSIYILSVSYVIYFEVAIKGQFQFPQDWIITHWTQKASWHNSSFNTTHSARNLGFIFDEHLTFSDHISDISKACYYHIRQLHCTCPYLDSTTACTIATSIVHPKLDYCNSLYYNLPKSQITRLQQIQNSLAHAVVDLISVQPSRSTRSSSLVTLARPSTSSSLRITDPPFGYASPCLWNQLPSSLRQPRVSRSVSLLPVHAPTTSHFVNSPLSPSIIPSLYHCRLKTYLCHKLFAP